MITSEDIETVANEVNFMFDNLPHRKDFFFIWKKANITPSGTTYSGNTFEAIPGILLPSLAENKQKSPEGELTFQEIKRLAIPKRWGETVTLNDITYIGGIQIHDRVVTQDGEEYRVEDKTAKGMRAYYILSLIMEKGYSDDWIDSQYR